MASVLEEKRGLLDRAIQAIVKPRSRLPRAGADTHSEEHHRGDRNGQNNDWSEKYYSPEARARSRNPAGVDAGVTGEGGAGLARPVRDVEQRSEMILQVKRAGSWRAMADLIRGFTGGDPEVSKGFESDVLERPNWPADMKARMTPFSNPKVWSLWARC